MAGEEGGTIYDLLETPTWAVATICFIFISLGIFIEHLLHLAGHWLKKHKRAALYDAMEKLKSVLMLLGFMSLLLTITQNSISKICIPSKVASSMLPCQRSSKSSTIKHLWTTFRSNSLIPHKTWPGIKDSEQQSELASENSNYVDHCAKGMTPLMSQEGINQLNIFIFVLAVMQIVSSVATMALGRAKMKKWKAWEKETQTLDYSIQNDPERFRFTRETTFGRRHATFGDMNAMQMWIKCFLHQFFHSVAKIDYLTLRHGFISAHFSSNSNSFNFQKYIQRSLEDDFKAVIGISPIMWFIVVIFLAIDVHGWNSYFWISFLPLIIVLFLGTKLEVIVATMAIQLTSQNTIIRGTPVVQPNNNLFWFNRPQLVLTLLHFALFMNAFEFAFFLWVTWQFGIQSCYHEYVEIIVVRVVLVILVQIICSYITLPLYALVTQMGSQYKSTILEEDTIHEMRQRQIIVEQEGSVESISQFGIESNSSTMESIKETALPNFSSSHEQTHYMTSFVSINGSEIVKDFGIYYQYHIEDANQSIGQNEIRGGRRI